jgi:catechol 2,3-dioxygenase-like lactoylglutathione lyase family enzyme
MTLQTIRVISIPVSDQDRARDFYRGTLGFEVVSDGPFAEGMRWLQLAPPAGGPTITLVTWFPTMPPGSSKGLVIECDDVRKTRDDLTGRGLAAGEIESAPWGTYFTFDDPDGNGWVVQEWPRERAQS